MEIAPSYRADLFVMPDEAYGRIRSRVQRWQDAAEGKGPKGSLWRARHHSTQTASGEQVLGLVAERGGGKTWLLRYLAEDDRTISTSSVCIDLQDRVRFSDAESYVSSVNKLLKKARKESTTGVLLLDNVPPKLDEPLRAFERAILWPQITKHGSLVIMALAHPLRICWRMPALRGAERSVLTPFDGSQTRNQLRKLQKARLATKGLKAAQVQAASGGLPLLNFLLAQGGKSDPWQALLNLWLDGVPDGERALVQDHMEAVCTLETLEHAKVKSALAAYADHQSGKKRRAHPGQVRNLLRKYWVARPLPDSPGRIVMVDSVRRAAREVLQSRDASLLAALEAVA